MLKFTAYPTIVATLCKLQERLKVWFLR